MQRFQDITESIEPCSSEYLSKSIERQSRLTKPAGALGALERIANQFASISSDFPPSVPKSPVVCIFASDHGVLNEGISPWPKEVTVQMVSNFIQGGAAINAIASQVGARVEVIDIGVDGDTSSLGGVIDKKIRRGTDNLARLPAMSPDEALAAIQAGFEVGISMVDSGADLLITGDMGIGNTTPSAALISWFAGSAIEKTTGRGTGIDDDRMKIKIAAIKSAHARLVGSGVSDPVEVLSSIGGLEIAGLVGLIIAGAYRKVPIVLDGVISNAAAVVSYQFNRNVVGYLFAGHLSAEPGAAIALAYLSLEPILSLDLRLGEGSGGCLSVPVIQAAVRTLVEMATFDSAGVSEG